ncbi:putative ABC transport system ATP-binding protein [Chromohalobacter marismortui]|uniref:Putative ABC transport system ATP-binding protein n=1 Tax=Chromohalobacter marismortui TaxID=42055 RepID=A0A4V3F3N9_9GAMM|nr:MULTISPECIES: ABC transporter ATP-binding protein [Chromohalobacter]MCI0509794.1 ABC transporter ATP-binding protein [Chromohalobacter sp.]MCI0592426.1 ABC transporter ATP-binding protein [Chromohalobacter sp.]TDU22016.1 putative ABC transport system ATP-binding protein [Chromohalobacter marismortui]
MKPLIAMEGVCKSYASAGWDLDVFDEAALSIQHGERCAIVGPSGAGKSTLLHLLGLLDTPDKGRLLFNGCDISTTTSDQRAQLRNQCLGFIFQNFHLLPRLTALENVALPLFYRGLSRAAAHQRAYEQLERVGLDERMLHRPASLSGGQCQRVAIARALVGAPALILADEPTGNLDSATTEDVLHLLLQLNREEGVTLVVVTHDTGLAQRLDRCFHVQNGKVTEKPHHWDMAHG